MRHFTVDLPCALCLNYSEFPNSCLLCQFSVRINLFDMLIDGGKSHIIQCRHHLLRQPDILVLIPHFIAGITLAGGGHKGQVLGGRAMNGTVLFLVRQITVPS